MTRKEEQGGEKIKNYYSFNTYSRNIILQPAVPGYHSTLVCWNLPKSKSTNIYLFTPSSWCAELCCNQSQNKQTGKGKAKHNSKSKQIYRKPSTCYSALLISEQLEFSLPCNCFHLTDRRIFLLTMAVVRRGFKSFGQSSSLTEKWYLSGAVKSLRMKFQFCCAKQK